MDIVRFATYYNKKMKNNSTKAKRIKTIADYFQKKERKQLKYFWILKKNVICISLNT